jgi:hypothetical protein
MRLAAAARNAEKLRIGFGAARRFAPPAAAAGPESRFGVSRRLG